MSARALTLLMLVACRPGPSDKVDEADDSGADDSGTDDSAAPDDSSSDSDDTDDTAAALASEITATATDLLGGATRISFTAPFPRDALTDVDALRLDIDGVNVPFQAAVVYNWWDASASADGVRIALIQVDASWMTGTTAALKLRWGRNLEGSAPGGDVIDLADDAISMPVDEQVSLAVRSIEEVDGMATLVETETSEATQYSARQPRVLVQLDPAAWTGSEAIGRTPVVADWSGLGFESLAGVGQGLSDYGRSAAFLQDYRLDARGVADPTEAIQWEFGRCSTLLRASVLTDDPDLLAEAHRLCTWYADEAEALMDLVEPPTINDPLAARVLHGRDLFDYVSFTGDYASSDTLARVAADLVAEPGIKAYAAGTVEGEIWYEQLVATAMEGIWYGFLGSGDPALLEDYSDLVGAIYTHVTGDAADLAAMGVNFPPQNCLVHTARQSGEGEDETLPWCAPWQTAILLDPLLQYRALTDDPRVDEILIAFGRFLRDTGTSYAVEEITYCDSFLEPSTCYETPADGEDPRMLLPLFAVGTTDAGERQVYPLEGDFAHCPDVAALAGASWAAFVRHPELDGGPVGPFASETESMRALTHELSACAAWTIDHYHRPRRNPSYWTAEALEAGLADPATFISSYKIGYPDYVNEPMRQPSWWYNTSIHQIPAMLDAGLSLPTLEVGQIQPEECADPTLSECPS